MKRAAFNHAKVHSLRIVLNVPLYGSRGLCEGLWQWTAVNAPAGDIGKWDDRTIADGLGWDREPKELIEALVQCRLIDRPGRTKLPRLVVHDWAHHAEDAVHMALARAAETFWDGTMPKLTRLAKNERENIERAYAQKTHKTRTANARKTHFPPIPSHPIPSHPIEVDSGAAVAAGIRGEVQERGAEAANTFGMSVAQLGMYSRIVARPVWLPEDREWIDHPTARRLALRSTSTPAHVAYWLDRAKARRKEVRDVNLAGFVIGKLDKPDMALVEALATQEAQ